MRMRKKPNLIPRMERCAPLLCEEPSERLGSWRELLPEARALWLELGCGKGRFTAQTARENPDALLIALEKVPEAMVVAMERALEAQFGNVRFIDGDALALPVLFAEDELDRIYINFCDPWKKNRYAKNRLTHPGFLRIYESILRPEGEIHFKTDNDPLFEYSVEMLQDEGWELLEFTRDLHAGGPCGVMTDYEFKFFEQGISINRLVAAKKGT